MKIKDILFEDELTKTNLLKKIPSKTMNDLEQINKAFTDSGFEIRMVGGCVRDLLQDKTPKDYDLATNATPEEMIQIGTKNKISVIPTGLAHGTITMVVNKEPYEITTLRIDTETDGRHAKVEFTTDWKQDAERRDLTFNAMSLDFNGNLYDYFGGADDLKDGSVRYVGDAGKRIQEDGLRILRWFRFLGRTKKPNADSQTIETISQSIANGALDNISGERVWMEFNKILSGDHINTILPLMNKTGVDRAMGLPNNGVNEISSGFKNLKDAKKYTNNPISLLSTLLHNESDIGDIVNNWKISSDERNLLTFLVIHNHHDIDDKKAKDMWTNSKIQKIWIEELLKVQGKVDLLDELKNWKVEKFPVSGKDLLDLGYKQGPDFGKLMKQLEKSWKDSGYILTKDQLLSGITNESI